MNSRDLEQIEPDNEPQDEFEVLERIRDEHKDQCNGCVECEPQDKWQPELLEAKN